MEESVYGRRCCWSAWTVNDPSPKAAPHLGVNRTLRPLVHYAKKTDSLDQPYWDRPARKTPRQKRTTASIVNSHYSLMMELRLLATTCVDHPRYATCPQIGVWCLLYSDSSRQSGDPPPAGGQYPLKPPGDTSPAWPVSPVTPKRSCRTAYCRPPMCCLTSPSSR